MIATSFVRGFWRPTMHCASLTQVLATTWSLRQAAGRPIEPAVLQCEAHEVAAGAGTVYRSQQRARDCRQQRCTVVVRARYNCRPNCADAAAVMKCYRLRTMQPALSSNQSGAT